MSEWNGGDVLPSKNGSYCVLIGAGYGKFICTRDFIDGRWRSGPFRWAEEVIKWRHLQEDLDSIKRVEE